MLSVAPAGEAAGVTSLSGNLSRAKEESKTFSMDSDHLENVGMMIEAMENTMRSDMDGEQVVGLVGLEGGRKYVTFRGLCTRDPGSKVPWSRRTPSGFSPTPDSTSVSKDRIKNIFYPFFSLANIPG